MERNDSKCAVNLAATCFNEGGVEEIVRKDHNKLSTLLGKSAYYVGCEQNFFARMIPESDAKETKWGESWTVISCWQWWSVENKSSQKTHNFLLATKKSFNLIQEHTITIILLSDISMFYVKDK